MIPTNEKREERISMLTKLTFIAQKLNKLERAMIIINKEYGEQRENGCCNLTYDQDSPEYQNRNSEHFSVPISKSRMIITLDDEIKELKKELDKTYKAIYGE